MQGMQIELPESVRPFLEKQAAVNGFADASEYVRSLIHAAELAVARRELEEKLVDGVRSPMSPLTDDDWAALRRQVTDRHPELLDR